MQKLTLTYRSALILLAILSIMTQFLVQFFIYQQKNDSTWINISGKQRMLSQKITKLVLLQSIEFKTHQAKELNKTLNEWKSSHQKIIHLEIQSDGLNEMNHNERAILLKKINQYFLQIYFEAKKIRPKNNQSIAKILTYEPLYLTEMDNLVKNYEKLAQKKLWLLSQIELTIFFIVILVLLLEGQFVFKPAIEFIKNQFDELTLTKKELEESLQEKSKLNTALKSSLNDLEAINYSLEGATTMITMNENGIIIKANKNFYQFTNLSADQVIGKRMTDLMVNPTQPEFLSHLWQELRSGKVWANEFKLMRKGKEPTRVDVTVIPVYNLNKKINFYIALMVDISNRIDNRLSIQKEQGQLIIYGQEKERKRIAIELHDGLGQILTGLKFTLESIKITNNEQAQNQLNFIKDLVIQTIQESRRISANLMPLNLEKYGLNGALFKLVEHLTLSHTIEIKLCIPQSIPRQEEEKELSIYRIIQELLNNAMKHAQANLVEINIKIMGRKLHLYIQDNGHGLYENKIASYGLGLNSIKQRIEDFDGQFFITNPKSVGTMVHCIIPLTFNETIDEKI